MPKKVGSDTNIEYVQAGAGVAFAWLGVVAPDLDARFAEYTRQQEIAALRGGLDLPEDVSLLELGPVRSGIPTPDTQSDAAFWEIVRGLPDLR